MRARENVQNVERAIFRHVVLRWRDAGVKKRPSVENGPQEQQEPGRAPKEHQHSFIGYYPIKLCWCSLP